MLERPPQILVLEDDEQLRETMADVLEDEGYLVVAVARGEDAVARASVQNFDLIVSDIRMDGMDGLEAIDQTRRLQPAVGSLVVSGYCSEQETLRAFALNVGGYLRKPFVVKEFLHSVRDILQRRQLHKHFQTQVDGYRQAWLWAHQQLMLNWEQQSYPGLQRWLALCQKLAQQAGHSPELAERLAASWAGRVAGACELPDWLQAEATSELEELALYLWPYAASDWPAAEELAGKFAAPLLQSYLSALSQPEQAPPATQGNSGSLLALAQNLEETQTAAATQAYDKLLTQPNEVGLQAWLGLARMAWRRQDLADWQQRLRQGAALAQSVPGGWGRALAALAILTRQPDLLAQARESLQAGAHNPELWLLDLADPVTPEARRTQAALQLLSPRWQAQLARNAAWVVPEILACAPAAAGRRLTFLAMDYAPHLTRLPERAAHSLLQAFQNCPQDLPEELLQALLSHRDGSVRQQAQELREGNTPESMVSLRLRSFGFFEAHCGARKILEGDWRTQKVKYMLAYLASRWDRPVGEDELLDLFWPEARGTGKRNLYVATSTIRKVLRPHPEALEVDYIVRQGGRLGLNLELPIWHDASEADLAWNLAQEHHKAERFAQSRECLNQVCDLAGGPFLEGCYLDWAVRRRSHWDERLSKGSLSLAQTALQQANWQEAVTLAERSLDWEPASLEAHAVRLRAHLGLRQPEAVIRHYEVAESSLRREFGLEPSTEMLEAYHRARHGIFS